MLVAELVALTMQSVWPPAEERMYAEEFYTKYIQGEVERVCKVGIYR